MFLPLSIRPGSETDLDALVVLLQECVAAMREAGIDQWDEVYPTRTHLLADVRANTLYVGSMDSHAPAGAAGVAGIAGVIVVNDYQDPEYAEVPWTLNAGRVAVVHRLMVAPRYQRRGIARALMACAEERALELGYAVIRLDAFTNNPRALHLYETLGYRDAGCVMLRKGPFRCFEKRLPERQLPARVRAD